MEPDQMTLGATLIAPETAYMSFRESGFDFPTAIGEHVDNSLQAGATRIDIVVETDSEEIDGAVREMISRVAVIDDGAGMDEETTQNCLKLGWTDRYNDRSGIGRFGVGATLAAISQCQRISVFTRTAADAGFLATYIDLEDIAAGDQERIPPPVPQVPPYGLGDRLSKTSGSIILWEKCDRLRKDPNGRPFAPSRLIDEDLRPWLARTYRYFLWEGLSLTVNGTAVRAWDPLWLRPETTDFPDDLSGELKFDHTIDWEVPNAQGETSPIRIIFSLLPRELRKFPGAGGEEPARQRRIPANEGISVLRHNREVAYGAFYPTTQGILEIDRWWGCEIHFEAVLDELWRVRNVKRGVRPVGELSEALRPILRPKIVELRNRIRSDWTKAEGERAAEEGAHSTPERVVAATESKIRPETPAGSTITPEQREEKTKAIVEDGDLPKEEQEVLKKKIQALPISIRTKAMASAEFIHTEHLGNGQMVLTFNTDHPFFHDVYMSLEDLEEEHADDNIGEMARHIRYAVDLLLMAYGRAESMIDLNDSEIESAVTNLRAFWGVQLRNYLKRLAAP